MHATLKQMCLVFLGYGLSLAALAAAPLTNAFFAMDTGTRDAAHTSLESQFQLVKLLGYDGFGGTLQSASELRELLSLADRQGIKLTTLYAALDLSSGSTNLPPLLAEAIRLLRDHDTVLWLTVQNSKIKPSDPTGDANAVLVLRELAAGAAGRRVRIALYPHAGTWVERVEDAVRLAGAVDRPNLGATFNLCHWLMVDGQNLDVKLQAALPYLFVVTINGADQGGRNWAQLIKPLDQGNYDVAGVLAGLRRLGYTGPVGLQQYGVGGRAEENLRHSMAAWRKFSAGQ